MNACLDPHASMCGRRPYLRLSRFPAQIAFSLIEVVIAIAIVSFTLVTLLGLMAYSSQMVHQADNYARLSNVTRQVLARLDSQVYAVTSTNVTAGGVYYFTYDGLPTNSAGAYYQCALSNVTPSASSLSALMQVQVNIRWPQPEFTNTNSINTSILNYD